jgi:hypothetical protein
LTANFLRNPCRYELTTSKGHMNVAVYTTALSTSRAARKLLPSEIHTTPGLP